MNNIIFRVDSSSKIATGHVMRCLTMAKLFKEKETNVIFICRNLEGNIIKRIIDSGFTVETLPTPKGGINSSTNNQYLDWLEVSSQQDVKETKEVISTISGNKILIIDHYAINENWENVIKNYVEKIVVIDDLANRKHNCDVIIDQNLYHNYKTRYDNLVPQNCQKFLGPNYAILREQFLKITPRDRTEIKNIMISFGGIDQDNLTLKSVESVIKAQELLKTKFNLLVIGTTNNHQENLKQVCKKHNFKYESYINNMASTMDWADLAIGAGGTMSWERCYLKLPAIVISLAQNQIELCQTLSNKGIIKYIGESDNVTMDDMVTNLINFYRDFSYQTFDLPFNINKVVEDLL